MAAQSFFQQLFLRLSGELLEIMFSHIRASIVEELKDAQYFAITTDAWTSKAMEKYIAVTVHFVNSNWELISECVAVIPLTVSHTWEALTRAIATRINALAPDDSVLVATVTDSAANMIKLALSLHTNLSVEELNSLVGPNVSPTDFDARCQLNEPLNRDSEELFASWLCIAHMMQHVALDAAEDGNTDADNLIESCRDMVRYIRGSSDRRKKLKVVQTTRIAAQQPAQQPPAQQPVVKLFPRHPRDSKHERERQRQDQLRPVQLILDVPTRWLTVQKLLDRFSLLYKDLLVCAAHPEWKVCALEFICVGVIAYVQVARCLMNTTRYLSNLRMLRF